nr:immunoglobulin light chain junction region [Macaca mulatta]
DYYCVIWNNNAWVF